MSTSRVPHGLAGILGSAFCALALLGLSGVTGLAAQQDEAKEQFGKLCATCHGATGLGDGPAAAALNPKPASFADSTFQASRTDEQLTAVITDGKPPMMPGFGSQLSPEQVAALVAYIRELGKTEE